MILIAMLAFISACALPLNPTSMMLTSVSGDETAIGYFHLRNRSMADPSFQTTHAPSNLSSFSFVATPPA